MLALSLSHILALALACAALRSGESPQAQGVHGRAGENVSRLPTPALFCTECALDSYESLYVLLQSNRLVETRSSSSACSQSRPRSARSRRRCTSSRRPWRASARRRARRSRHSPPPTRPALSSWCATRASPPLGSRSLILVVLSDQTLEFGPSHPTMSRLIARPSSSDIRVVSVISKMCASRI